MGFVKQAVAKITGADVQADIAERSANEQAAATRKAAELAAKDASESAQQAARQQQLAVERQAIESRIAEKPVVGAESPDIQLGTTNSAGAARARRQKFGVGTGAAGISI